MQSTANQPVVGMDIAKNVFQLHLVDNETGEIERHKLKREKVTSFFANRQKSLIAMEACGGAHHWARTLQSLGHEVKLLPANHVKPFVLRDKTDARDAQAIWVAAQQPHIKPVPVKSERQQACWSIAFRTSCGGSTDCKKTLTNWTDVWPPSSDKTSTCRPCKPYQVLGL